MSNILGVPFKSSYNVDLCSPYQDVFEDLDDNLKQKYLLDLITLDNWRQACLASYHFSTNELIADNQVLWIRYYLALIIASQKLPMFKAWFKWSNAFKGDEEPTEENSLHFEICNVLYNLGAYYSNLGNKIRRDSIEAIKRSCGYFENAAGIFDMLINKLHLKNEFQIHSISKDLSYSALNCLKALMLAQVQECIWQVAVIGKKSNSSIFKLAGHVSKLYETAYLHSSNAEIIDLFDLNWNLHLRIKIKHFKAAAYYRKSIELSSLPASELAYLKIARDAVEDALKIVTPELKYEIVDDLKSLAKVVLNRIYKLSMENEYINFQDEVTVNEELPTFNMAQSKIPKCMDSPEEAWELIGEKPLFQYLLPYLMQQGPKVYKARKNEFVKIQILEPLKKLISYKEKNPNESIQKKKLDIPDDLLEKISEVQAKGGQRELENKFNKIKQIKIDCHNHIKSQYQMCLNDITEAVKKVKLNQEIALKIETFKKRPQLMFLKFEEADKMDKNYYDSFTNIKSALNKFDIILELNSEKLLTTRMSDLSLNGSLNEREVTKMKDKLKEIHDFMEKDDLKNKLTQLKNIELDSVSLESLISKELKKYEPYLNYVEELNEFEKSQKEKISEIENINNIKVYYEACDAFHRLLDSIDRGFVFYDLLTTRFNDIVKECEVLIKSL